MKQLLEFSNDPYELEVDGQVVATVMDDIRWCAIGRYPDDSKMGGCDTMKTIQQIKDAIWTTHRYYPNHWIVFEGMMISTIKSTFYDYLMEMYKDRIVDPCFVILRADVDTCVKHITSRGTRRNDLNIGNVANKCELVVRHALTYDQDHVRWLDVANIPLDHMVIEFLLAVGDEMMAQELMV